MVLLTKSWLISLAALAFALGGALSTAHAQSLDDNQGPVEMSDTDSGAEATPSKTPVTSTQSSQPQVGRRAASRFMTKRSESGTENAKAEGGAGGRTARSRRPASSGSGEHYMAVHVGAFLSDNAYLWGEPPSQSNVGGWNVGVTYRVGEWVNSMDLAVKIDAQTFNLAEGRAMKLSFMPAVTFPDADARFPLYFGAGAGLGVFIAQQPRSESVLSLDYQLFGGLRFFDVLENTGFFIEGGLKNHFLLLSDGQFNGVFTALGCVFTF